MGDDTMLGILIGLLVKKVFRINSVVVSPSWTHRTWINLQVHRYSFDEGCVRFDKPPAVETNIRKTK